MDYTGLASATNDVVYEVDLFTLFFEFPSPLVSSACICRC